MGPITYSLCKSQGISLLMLVTGLCAFPPVIDSTPVSLAEKGPLINQKIEIPVNTDYELQLRFHFNDTNKDDVRALVGNGARKKYCRSNNYRSTNFETERDIAGVPIHFQVFLTPLEGELAPIKKEFNSLCRNATSSTYMMRNVGELSIKRGSYIIEIFNTTNHPELQSINVDFLLQSSDRF
ncbi:DUF5625 family protein [Cohaesibacter marisflavi]|uniref:DUF5625 family protein n=1 Tax=Cohaesibacter marisflavi TaxID=655353 RepID=UPI0029C85AF6|nr:DUF5625 family protein [Cohaesibacter marisflavi]